MTGAVRFDALLFDFDGVLIDSEALGNRHIAEWLTAAGHPITAEESMANFMGLAGPQFVDAIERWIDRPLPEAFYAARKAEDDRVMAAGIDAIAGAVAFVRAFFDAAKPVAVICHGPWTLVEAGVVAGRTLTSWPSVQTDLRNAGATWVDEEVHVDQGLVSSRKPDDLPAFCAKLVEEFAEGEHEGQRRSVSATA